MTERLHLVEQLNLAAAALGIKEYLGAWLDNGFDLGFLSGRLCNGRPVWNPRDDDGDSFKMAVALGLNFSFVHSPNRPELKLPPRCAVVSWNGMWFIEESSGALSDNRAARLAILKAAIEIGRSVQQQQQKSVPK